MPQVQSSFSLAEDPKRLHGGQPLQAHMCHFARVCTRMAMFVTSRHPTCITTISLHPLGAPNRGGDGSSGWTGGPGQAVSGGLLLYLEGLGSCVGGLWQATEFVWPDVCRFTPSQFPVQPRGRRPKIHESWGEGRSFWRRGVIRGQILKWELRVPFGHTEARVDDDLGLHLVPAGRGRLLPAIALVVWREQRQGGCHGEQRWTRITMHRTEPGTPKAWRYVCSTGACIPEALKSPAGRAMTETETPEGAHPQAHSIRATPIPETLLG